MMIMVNFINHPIGLEQPNSLINFLPRLKLHLVNIATM
jgi:hypothetical protein